MAKPMSYWRQKGLLDGKKRFHIKVDREEGGKLDEFRVLVAPVKEARHTIVTSRTGSKNGQHMVVYTIMSKTWLQSMLAGAEGLVVWEA